MNTTLIAPWGIGGAAAATLIAYAVYFLLLLTFVWRKLRVSLFSWGQAKTLVVIVVMMGAALAWSRWVTPLVGNIIVDAIIKTVILGGAAVVAVYRWHISPTVNELINRIIHTKKI